MRCLSAPPLQISHFFPARLGDDFLAESGRRAVFGADGTPTEGGAFVGPFAFCPFAARKASISARIRVRSANTSSPG